MEKDKMELIKQIITLVDTEDGLEEIKKKVSEVLSTQWKEEEKDKEEFEKWRKEKKQNPNTSDIDDIPF
jgi:hypothetical protein